MNSFLPAAWTWYPSVLLGLGLWTAAYLAAIGPLRRKFAWGDRPAGSRQLAFHAGTLVALLALVSPLDGLGDEYLFSAHMAQHVLLMFFVAPLWLIGLPGWLIEHGLAWRPARSLAGNLTSPGTALIVFVAVMWLWHLPALYNRAASSEGLHIFEHLTFIGGALIGWWPVAGPGTGALPRPAAPLRILYLFVLAMGCTLMAALLTFAGAPLYVFYADAPRLFGLSVLADQRLGGLLMWFPTHMILLLAIGLTFNEWLRAEHHRGETGTAKSYS
jgi:putative membrane protein